MSNLKIKICSIKGKETELECLLPTVEKIKELVKIKDQSLKEIQVEQVNLKHELKKDKGPASKLHTQLNWID